MAQELVKVGDMFITHNKDDWSGQQIIIVEDVDKPTDRDGIARCVCFPPRDNKTTKSPRVWWLLDVCYRISVEEIRLFKDKIEPKIQDLLIIVKEIESLNKAKE